MKHKKDGANDANTNVAENTNQSINSAASDGKITLSRKKNRIKLSAIILACLLLIGFGAWITKEVMTKKENKPEIITESSLYKIINVSELSTYQCVYNDICTVKDQNNPEKVLYHCAYDAKVDAGIDFTKVKIDVEKNDVKNIITVTIPPVEIKDVNVDIGTLDYMFEDDSANTNTVSEQAYKLCILDVEKKSKEESKIYDLARQNAENIIKALVNPFVEQVSNGGKAYELNIVSQEKGAESE